MLLGGKELFTVYDLSTMNLSNFVEDIFLRATIRQLTHVGNNVWTATGEMLGEPNEQAKAKLTEIVSRYGVISF